MYNVALAVLFSEFHSAWLLSDLLYRLNCHVDKQPVVGICSSMDSGLLATDIKMSKSHHNLIILSLLIQTGA